ncbi:hypothetical protein HPG69_014758, partial [Diceros bicornis minor]
MLELKVLEPSDLTELRTTWMLQSMANWHCQQQERSEGLGEEVPRSDHVGGLAPFPPARLLTTPFLAPPCNPTRTSGITRGASVPGLSLRLL